MALTSVADGLFAERHGSGSPAVVALHGWGRRGADFDAVLRGLDAWAIDLPGFGASPPPVSAMGARGYAELLAPVLSRLPAPPLVVGHSFGGRVAVCLGARVPVRGVVLTGVPLVRLTSPATAPWPFRVVRAAHRAGLVSDARMERWRRSRGSADYRASSGVMRDVLVTAVHESYESELAAQAAPVTLVWGREDREVPPDVAERAGAILTGAGVRSEVMLLDGVGHLTPLEAPDVLRRVIDRMGSS